MVWKEQAKAYRDDDQKTIKSGQPKLNYEEPQTTPKGKKIWLRTSKIPLTDLDGNTIGVLGTYEDITERKKVEQDLQESKALNENIIENIPLMIFLKDAKDLKFVIFNRAGENLLGYNRNELLGKSDLNLFPKKQASNFMAKDREALNDKAGFIDIPEEPISTAKKGERILHTRKVCIKGMDGSTKYLLGISEDITEKKKAEEELKASRDILQEKIIDLERFNRISIDRELRMIELKNKIKELEEKINKN
jgi:PAS domain S-box-containing protein